MAKRDYQTFAHCKVLAGCGGSWRFKKANGTFVTKRDTDELGRCGVYPEDFVARVCPVVWAVRQTRSEPRRPETPASLPNLSRKPKADTVVGFQTFSEVISEAERRRDVSERTCGGLS
jgi:hypothetical protein